MKWLISLSLLQTLLLCLVALRVFIIDARTNELTEASENMRIAVAAQSTRRGDVLQAPATTAANGGVALAADEIRVIIREEIAASSGNNVSATAAKPERAVTPAYDPAQTALARAGVDKEIDRLRRLGAANSVDMDKLHAKIAELPPAEQRAALVKLTRAINDGEIEAQF